MQRGEPNPFFDTVTIATPEGIELELTLAGIGSRFAARLLDDLIRGAVLLVLAMIALPLILGSSGQGREGSVVQAGAIIVVSIVAFLVLFGYDVAFEVWGSGRSPGKRAAGLRVIEADGGPVGFRASAVRNLVRIVDAFPPPVLGFYAVAMVSVAVTQRNQRLGDIAAGTLVVVERKGTSKSSPAGRPAMTQPDAAMPNESLAGWDVSAVTVEDLTAIRRFLERRWSLAPEARGRLAWQLERAVRPKVAGAPAGMHPEVFLERLSAAKAARG